MPDVIVLDSIGSTNNYLKENYGRLNDHTVVIALRQTDGRGRLGRAWEAGDGSLYLSILIKNKIISERITLLCALAVSDALEALYHLEAGIKWPNDILINSKKICGILVEGIYQGSEISHAVIGIGININNEGFPKDITNKATSVYLETGVKGDIIKAGGRVADEVIARCSKAASDITEEYSAKCVTLGKTVHAVKDAVEITGLAVSINPDGSLVLETDGSRISIYSGDVTLSGGNS